jgi:DNA adenine methylase
MILKACFGGKGGTSCSSFGYGTQGRARFNRMSLAAVHRCHKRLAGVIVEQLDFADCIRRYDRTHTFFYCDPPYIGTAGYQADFSLADHNRLAGALAKIKGKFLLSINDCSTARQVYGGFKIKTVTTTYTVCRDKSPDAQKLAANY